ncbi:MAG: hypothetical protein DRQ51_07335 [Gammaproteobacteria bacterium]|nr:MAG: hypothetical protein DRQ51_07335 [Gammaproteobacteria bacterium]
MKPEYTSDELGKGVRGKYVTSYKQAHNIVAIKKEVFAVFPNEKAINDALLTLIRLTKKSENNTASIRV